MKSFRIITGLVLVLIAGAVLAQGVPQLINYQGRLTDDTGLPIDGTREMRFRMLDADTLSASVLWSETQSSVQVDQGIYHVLLGSVNPVPPSAISQADIYLEVRVEGEILRPRSQISSVPFAHKAASVPDSSITSAMITDGTITGSDIDSQTITGSNIADGTITSTQIQDIYVLNTGDTVTGDLQVDGHVGIGRTPDSTRALHAAWSSDPNDHYAYLGSEMDGVFARAGAPNEAAFRYGGRFYAHSLNSPTGAYGLAYGYGSQAAYGVRGSASNISTGPAYGGYFTTSNFGTGAHYGVYSWSNSDSSSTSIGVLGRGENASTGPAYGGYFFTTVTTGTGTQYGIYASANDYAGWFQNGSVHVGDAGVEDYANSDGDLYVEDALEVDGAAYFSGGIDAPGAIDASDVNFNYAGSASKGGPASDLDCTDCVSSSEVQFNYAGSTSEGGSASDLECTDCLNETEIEDIYVLNSGDTVTGTLYLPANGLVAGTDQLVLSGGNVGIGVASPTAELDVTGSSTNGKSLRLRSGDMSTDFDSNQILLSFDGTDGYSHAIKSRHNGTSDARNAIDFYVWDYGTDAVGDIGTKHVMSLNAGNVGIGTDSPKMKLHVAGGTYAEGHIYLHAYEGDGSSGTAYLQARDDSGTSSIDMQLRTQNAGSIVNAMHIQTDGDVGIGTTSPGYKLHVVTPTPGDRAGYFENTYSGAIDGYGVYGRSVNADYYGLGGYFEGGSTGVYGNVYPTGNVSYTGVLGQVFGGSGTNYAVYGFAGGTGTNWAGYFSGNVNVTGTLSKGGGSFKIDHPLDPENKYLYHSFVESPDMKNVYDGVVVMDDNGEAQVYLPDWFEALNRDFRYQLTAIGAPGPDLYIAEKIKGNSFKISGGTPGMEVSWMVTGIRKDAFAEANRIQVEVEKSEEDKGKYIHPEAFGKAEELGIDYKHRVEHMEKGGKSSD